MTLLVPPSASLVKTSSLLEKVVADSNSGKVTFAYFLHQFERRSFAGIFFILAVLCLLPGVSVIAGFVMILPSVQLLLGWNVPAFPHFIDNKTIAVKRLRSWSSWLIPKIEWLEQYVKPRYLFLSSRSAQYLIGFVALVMAVIVAVPFPLSNFLPAFAMLFISIGMLERDGLMIGVGLLISLLAFLTSFAVVKVIYSSLMYFLGV